VWNIHVSFFIQEIKSSLQNTYYTGGAGEEIESGGLFYVNFLLLFFEDRG
jgi:hypothetical protein